MFEMCISTFSEPARACTATGSGRNSSRFTKFGITAILQPVQPKAR